jgi:methyl-accepting chemotaxis protein
MKLSHKIPLIIIGVATLVSAVNAYSYHKTQLQVIETAKRQQLRNMSSLINASIENQSKTALALAQTVTTVPSVRQAFEARDRNRLLNELLPTYKLLKTNYGVEVGHFHIPPAISFLRLNNPKKFGDDLSRTRDMVLLANSRQDTYSGIEIGPSGVAIRGITPVLNQGKSLGSFEIGFSFDPMLEQLKGISDSELAAFVDAQLIAKVAGSQSANLEQEVRVVGAFREVGSTNWELVQAVVNAEALKGINDTTYRFQAVQGIDYGVVSVPLLDFSGRNIGVIVAVQSFEGFQRQANSMLLTVLSITVLEIVAIAGAVLLVVNGLLLRPILALNEQLAMATKGKFDDQNGLSKRKDEVGLVAQNCHELQQKLAEYVQQDGDDVDINDGHRGSSKRTELIEHE